MGEQKNKVVEIGDVVQLKGGGPDMTVESVDHSGVSREGGARQVGCVWFSRDAENRWQVFRHAFKDALLVQVGGATSIGVIEEPRCECGHHDIFHRVSMSGDSGCGECACTMYVPIDRRRLRVMLMAARDEIAALKADLDAARNWKQRARVPLEDAPVDIGHEFGSSLEDVRADVKRAIVRSLVDGRYLAAGAAIDEAAQKVTNAVLAAILRA